MTVISDHDQWVKDEAKKNGNETMRCLDCNTLVYMYWMGEDRYEEMNGRCGPCANRRKYGKKK